MIILAVLVVLIGIVSGLYIKHRNADSHYVTVTIANGPHTTTQQISKERWARISQQAWMDGHRRIQEVNKRLYQEHSQGH